MTYDWPNARSTLAASRHFGPVSTRIELRSGGDREVRAGITIPISSP